MADLSDFDAEVRRGGTKSLIDRLIENEFSEEQVTNLFLAIDSGKYTAAGIARVLSKWRGERVAAATVQAWLRNRN